MTLTNKSSEENTDTRETVDGEDSTSDTKNTTHDDIKRNRIKLATKLLIDTKYSLMDDFNYNRGFSRFKDETASKENPTNPSNSSESGSMVSLDRASGNRNNGNHNEDKDGKNLGATIPRSTRIKADRVRIYLDNYYTKLEGCISIENSEHLHEGVEGVYNPLQVIRNRKLKNKYNEMPARQFLMRKPPLIAILNFSKKPHKKMPWFVDVTESASDMTWRTSHWDELVDPHGNLWFGKKDPSSHIEGPYNKARGESRSNHKNHHHHHHHHHLRKPHHISLSSRRGSGTGATDSSTTAEDGDMHGTPMEYTKLLKSFNENDFSDKEVNHLTPTEYEDEESLSADSERSRLNRFEMMIRKPKWSRSPNTRRRSHGGSTEKFIAPLHHTRTGSTTARTPRHSRGSASSGLVSNTSITPLANNSTSGSVNDSHTPRGTLLNAVTVHRLRNPGAEVAVDDDEEEDEKEIDPLQEEPFNPAKSADRYGYEQIDEKLQEQMSTTRFLMGAIKVVRHRKMTNDIIKRNYIQKRRVLHHDENMPLIVNSTSEMFKTYDEELDKALKKGNNYASSLLNDYSMCVETLISTTDRILSDINTTLTLKLKMFQENADRFGSLRMMKTQKLTKILYTVLEILIITVFWTIWLAVSILKCAKLSVVLTIRLLKWMLW